MRQKRFNSIENLQLKEEPYGAMSLREEFCAREYPVVTCPGCTIPMKLLLAVPANGREHVTYQCEKCRTETTRTIMPPSSGKR